MLNSPFMQAGATRSLSKGLLKTSKFSFNGILTNLEKTVSTINQVIPLYNQVRPLISNSKTIINAFKSSKPTKNNNNINNLNSSINTIDVNYKEKETINLNQNEKKDLKDIFTNKNTPNKPFFN